MKIAVFTDTYLPEVNGVTFSVQTYAKLLAQNHEVIIFAPAYKRTDPETERDGRLTVVRYRSVPLLAYKTMRLALPGVGDLFSEVERFCPDVIHFHTPSILGFLGILAAKRLRKPLVGTYHTLLSETLVYVSPRKVIEKYLNFLDRAAEELGFELKIRKELQETREKDTVPQRMTWSAVNKIYSYSDIVICPSEAIKRELIKRNMKKPIAVISNGVDLKLFSPKTSYTKTGQILHVGRMGYEKNVDVVIKAFGLIKKHMPETRLVIAGDGPALPELKQLAVSEGLSDSVEFLGNVERSRLGEIYRKSEVFVTASTFETQGLVILEAMASGLPVVGVDKYAIRDMVKDKSNGYVLKPFDTRGLADGVVRILRDLKMQERMGKGSLKAAQQHDVHKLLVKMEDVYRQVQEIPHPKWSSVLTNRIRKFMFS